MSVSIELLLLRVVGEVIVRVDSLVEESGAVQVVICCWGCEITQSVSQEDTALVVVRELFWGEAYCGVSKVMSICIKLVNIPYISNGCSNADQALVRDLQSTDVQDIGLGNLAWAL